MIQWQTEKRQKDNQRSTKQHMETKDRATRTPLKTGGHIGCFGWACSSCSISSTRRATLVTNSCPSRVATKHSFVSYHTFLTPQLLLKHSIETNETYTYHYT